MKHKWLWDRLNRDRFDWSDVLVAIMLYAAIVAAIFGLVAALHAWEVWG